MSTRTFRVEVTITTIANREAWFKAEDEREARQLAKADQASSLTEWQNVGDDTTDYALHVEACEDEPE